MAATIQTWVNNSPPQVNAMDLNGFKNENNQLITSAGIALDTGDNNQTTQAVSTYAAGGDYYNESGVADAYVLNPVGSKLAPKAYFEGMKVSFVPANSNTGASSINVASLGVKSLKAFNGDDLFPASLIAGDYVSAFYDGTDFRLIVLREATTFTSDNYIINGGFRFAQRGKSFNLVGAQGVFVSDRWIWEQTAGTTAIDNFKITNNFPSNDGELTNGIGINRTIGGGVCSLKQKIEGVSRLAGRKASLAIQMPTNSFDVGATCDIEITQNFGSGGAPDAPVTTNIGQLTFGIGYTPQQFVFDVPTIITKNVGDQDDYLELKLIFSDHLYDINFVSTSLIESSQPHLYQRRLEQQELALCQRFFRKSYNVDTNPGTITNDGCNCKFRASTIQDLYEMQSYFQNMRDNPTVVWYNGITGAANNIRIGAVDEAISLTFDESEGSTGVPRTVSGGPVGAVGDIMVAHYTAESEL